MTESEFWKSLEQVFGSALGHSLASDLYLASLSGTAREALAAGVKPDLVWVALVDEAGAGEEARWVHRRPIGKRRAR